MVSGPVVRNPALKILYTVADLQPESGGPTRSVSALAEAVDQCLGASAGGGAVEVVTLGYGGQSSAPMIPRDPVITSLVPCCGGLARKFKWSRAFLPALLAHCQPTTGLLLHDHGLWLPSNHAAARVARATGIPFIISPRGMLTAWALQFRGWKKKLAWHLYQRRDLQAASVLHATSRAEADGFRMLGLQQPIAIIPNGVTLPPAPRPSDERGIQGGGIPRLPGSSPVTDAPTPRPTDSPPHRNTALFLGRIHPVKGLLDLVGAWAALRKSGGPGATGGSQSPVVRDQLSAWRLVIAGGDENGHRREVEAAIRERGLENEFVFVGEVSAAQKWEIYQDADLFVLPSRTENFGMAIAEALACGLPVITTKGTPWQELATHRCGWWVEPAVEPLASALREATALTDAERQEMGRRGRKLVEENYTWPAAAAKMLAVYRWMLGQGERPECVSVLRQ